MRRILLGFVLALAVGAPLQAAERTYGRDGGGGKPEVPPLVIDALGVGAVNRHTEFTEAALKAALPGYAVKVETLEGEGGMYEAGMVRQGKALILQIYGSVEPGADGKRHVLAVTVHSSKVLSNLGPVVGTPWAKAKDDMETKDCVMGEEAYSGAMLCPSAQVINLTYVLRGKDEGGADGAIPPPAALKRFRITEIQWRDSEQE